MSAQSDRADRAESARIDADIARREAELEVARAQAARHRAEALRVAAESAAHQALRQRDEAIARVDELEAALADTAPAAAAPAAPAAPAAATAAAPGGPDITFAPCGTRPGLTVLLSAAALLAAAYAVYLACLDRLSSSAGIVTAGVTLALVLAINRAGKSGTAVEIRRGVVSIEGRNLSVSFDLTNRANLVQMIGTPGERGWKVILLRKSKPPVSVDASMVDPQAFTESLRGWRPGL